MNIHSTKARTPGWSRWLVTAATAALLSACGGGGGDSTPASTATGAGEGTVTGFGSVIVDGVRYDDRKVRISVDTEAGAPDSSSTSVTLKLGHHVALVFTGAESDSSATTVKVSAEIVGKVSAVAPELVVAGQTVKVNTDPAAGPVTVFEGYSSAADIAVGDRIEVHGVPTGVKTVQATRIERKPSADQWLRVAGTIAGLASDGSSFQLGGLTIQVAAGTRLVPANAVLANGLRVVVWSDTAGDAATGSTVVAKIVRVKRHQESIDHARVAGAITDCTPVCDTSFKVGGITVDASNATFVNGTKAQLANGRWVELRGTLDAATNTLVATRVVFRKLDRPHEEVKLRGAITDYVDAGSFKVRGTLDAATNTLVATRVVFRKLDRPHEEVKLRGAITDYVDATSFKVRGVPVTTDSTTTIGATCPSPLANGTLVALSGSVSGFKVLAKAIECFTSPDGFIVEGKGKIVTLDTAAKTFTLDGALFANLTLSWNDTTRFADGKTAADLAIGAELEVNGVVSGATVTVTRIEFEDHVSNPLPGIALFETKGVASNVVLTGGKLASFTVNGLDFTADTALVVIAPSGAVADGATMRVVFKKTDAGNVALLVKIGG